MIALPVGLLLAFKAEMGLYGIWVGMLLALFIVAAIEIWFILRTDWEKLALQVEATMAKDNLPTTV